MKIDIETEYKYGREKTQPGCPWVASHKTPEPIALIDLELASSLVPWKTGWPDSLSKHWPPHSHHLWDRDSLGSSLDQGPARKARAPGSSFLAQYCPVRDTGGSSEGSTHVILELQRLADISSQMQARRQIGGAEWEQDIYVTVKQISL